MGRGGGIGRQGRVIQTIGTTTPCPKTVWGERTTAIEIQKRQAKTLNLILHSFEYRLRSRTSASVDF
jgi:hypothetical protein